MEIIEIQNSGVRYNKSSKSFWMNGDDVRFATRYTLLNIETQGRLEFEFKYSTGSEWDADTLWIYENNSTGYNLVLTNGSDVDVRSERYLKHKLQN